jgi:hypothetical protein
MPQNDRRNKWPPQGDSNPTSPTEHDVPTSERINGDLRGVLGGPGPDTFDSVGALEKWREQSVQLDRIIGRTAQAA